MEAPSQPDTDQPTDAAEPAPLLGQVLAERYRIEALLGEGGMGAVYRARHVHMHKTVALKVLHREMTQFPEAVARFEREAVAGGRVEHPNVAAAMDFGRMEDGAFFLVLEFVEGRSLRTEIEERGALAPGRCVRIARQIASALNAAHKLGIVHRDLKPENIMLAERPGEPDFVKVLDFGIAKVNADKSDGPALTRLGAVFGTPDYMSPEQALGKSVDSRSDLYSLGVMLYEMTTGRRPFDDDDPVNVLAAQIGKTAPPLPEHVHPLLAALIRSLLNKAPEERVQSGAEVVQALEQMAAEVGASQPQTPVGAVATAGSLASSPSIQVGGLASVGIGTDILGNPSQPSITLEGMPSSPSDEGPVSAVHPTALAGPPTPVAVVPVAAAGAPGPSAGAQLDKLVATARKLWERAGPWVLRPIRIGSASFPAAVLAAVPLVALLVLAVVIGVIAALLRPSPKPVVAVFSPMPGLFHRGGSSASTAAIERKHVTPEEVQRLESVAVYKRKLEDWLDLGRGYAAMQRPKDSALAYRAALQLDRAPRNDPAMLADLRELARHPDAYSLVVNVCEGGGRGLGEAGHDLLWDLWLDFQERPEAVGYAESTFKKLHVLSRRVSPALRVAIELNASSQCDPVVEILDRTFKYGDQRSVPRLRQMELTTGCGVDKNDDCWRCLRGSDALVNARKMAESRPAPKMERGYR